jgi:hypothetical protein
MGIKCFAENYEVTKTEDNKLTVSNVLYKSSVKVLFLTAFCEILLPSVNSFNVPISISFNENPDLEVTIDEKLNVTGTENFEKFISESDYKKWKKTYRAAHIIFIGVILFLTLILGYIFAVLSDFNPIMGFCTGVVLTLSVILSVRLIKQQKLAEEYIKKGRLAL